MTVYYFETHTPETGTRIVGAFGHTEAEARTLASREFGVQLKPGALTAMKAKQMAALGRDH